MRKIIDIPEEILEDLKILAVKAKKPLKNYIEDELKNKHKMNYTKEQLEKLPKWAQSEIKRLQGLTQTLNQRLSEFNGEVETNTYLVEGLDKKPLTNNAQIEFATGHNKMNKVTVYVHSNGIIDINSYSRLGQELVILPRAANSFYLTFIER